MENTGENINLNNKRLDSISRRNVEAMRLLPGAMPPKMSVINERNLFGGYCNFNFVSKTVTP